MVELAALALRPSTFDPAGSLQAAVSIDNARTQNEMARLRTQELLAEQQENTQRRGALGNFRTQGGMNNPAAVGALAGHPDLYSNVQTAMSSQQQQQLAANARAAYRVMGLPEGSPQRAAAWREELDVARRDNRLTPEMYQRYAALEQPPQLLLQSLISQARAIPSELDSAHAGLYTQQAEALRAAALRRQQELARLGLGPPPASGGPPAAPAVGRVATPAPAAQPMPGIAVDNTTGMPPGLGAQPGLPGAPPAPAPGTAPPAATNSRAPLTQQQVVAAATPMEQGRLRLLIEDGKFEDAAKFMGEIEQRLQTERNLAGGLTEIAGIANRYGGDRGVFGSAVGPFQGPEPGLLSNPGGLLARTWGSLTAALGASGPNNQAPPAEVRRAVEGATNTLAAIIKPLIRKPGEGSWSDADQALLQSIVGNFSQVNDVAQYHRELDNVRRRINAHFNMNLPAIAGTELTPPAAALQALQANPALAAEFDAKYGSPGNPNPSRTHLRPR